MMTSTSTYLVIIVADVKDDWRRNVLLRLLSLHQTFLPKLEIKDITQNYSPYFVIDM